jgi:cell division protein FtsW
MSPRLRTDWQLFGAILLLVAFGLVMVYSASAGVADRAKLPSDVSAGSIEFGARQFAFVFRQIPFALFGLAIMLILKRSDYRNLQHPLWVFVPIGFAMLLLAAAIAMDGVAHRWIRLGGFQLQPSELAKPVLILFLAWFVSRRENKVNDKHTLLPAALVVGGLTGLVCFGDLGTAAVLLIPAVVVFGVAGIERKYFYLSLALAVLVMLGFIWQKPYRLLRVMAFVGITEKQVMEDPRFEWLEKRIATSRASRDPDHQSRQAKYALGSGGVVGQGLGQGNQKLGYLPEPHTDFILGVIGEETGLLGTMTLLGAYLLIFWRGLRLFWLTQDSFGRYLALGCITLIIAQAFFNMSVVVGIAPTKGIPLPLISYGGSAIICTLATFGLLLSVSDRAN